MIEYPFVRYSARSALAVCDRLVYHFDVCYVVVVAFGCVVEYKLGCFD